MLRSLFLALLLCLGAPALAQPAPVRVVLVTSEGEILVEVDVARATITAANFLRYVDRRRFDGANFYRSMRGGPDRGLIQAGPAYPRLPPIAHEPTSATGLSHVEGAVSIARNEPGSATADITIMIGDMTYLDAGGADPLGYAVFGRVVGGMDVVRRIHAAPTSPTEGEGSMRGQMLAPKIVIRSARRVP